MPLPTCLLNGIGALLWLEPIAIDSCLNKNLIARCIRLAYLKKTQVTPLSTVRSVLGAGGGEVYIVLGTGGFDFSWDNGVCCGLLTSTTFLRIISFNKDFIKKKSLNWHAYLSMVNLKSLPHLISSVLALLCSIQFVSTPLMWVIASPGLKPAKSAILCGVICNIDSGTEKSAPPFIYFFFHWGIFN